MPASDRVSVVVPALGGQLANSSALRKLTAIAGTTALVALSAHASIPLPFTPVPLTLQTLAVLLAGILLGPTMAFAALTLYLLEGASGLPVFSPAGPGGLLQLLGPTAGFLFSYPAAAALAGWLYRHRPGARRPALGAALAGIAALVLIFISGAGWLATVLHLSARAAVSAAVLPFLPGEALKVLALAGLVSALHHSRDRAQIDQACR